MTNAEKQQVLQPGGPAPQSNDARLDHQSAAAVARLAASGRLAGKRSVKISARLDPGLMAAAADRLGLSHTDISQVLTAALALAAAPDPFKAWLRTTEDTLPADFELAV